MIRDGLRGKGLYIDGVAGSLRHPLPKLIIASGSPTLVSFTSANPAFVQTGFPLSYAKDGDISGSTPFSPATDGTGATGSDHCDIIMQFSAPVALRYISFFLPTGQNAVTCPYNSTLTGSDTGTFGTGASFQFLYPCTANAWTEGDYGDQGSHTYWKWTPSTPFTNALVITEMKASLTSGGTSLLGN